MALWTLPILRVLFASLSILLCFLPFTSLADEVNYSYDDAGRLVRVAKDTERILYQYDEVGNLLAIFRETGAPQALAPTLQGIDPDSFIIGNHYSFSITGQNLLTTNSVTSDNPAVNIKNIAVLDTKIIATLSVAAGASAGMSNITVTTSYGSATLAVGIYQASITPALTSLFPGINALFSVSLTPAATRTLTVPVNNKTPGVIETQPSVAIPQGGTVDFTVTTLRYGTGTVQIGTAEATVDVVGENALINASPVSVLVGRVPDNAVIYSQSVAIIFGDILSGPVTSYNSVSVGWPVTWNSSVSSPVSVVWPLIPGAVTVSMPVCVQISGN